MIVLSPHLDDAVFSCSAMLDSSTVVVTVCAGIPPYGTPPSEFDERAGFTSGAEAMKARRREDRIAAQIGNFQIHHLDLLDAHYAEGEPLEKAVRKVAKWAEDAGEQLLGPVGLRHPDHKRIAGALPDSAWRYEELPYAYVWPVDNGEPEELPGAPWKEEAVRAYRSQITEATHMAEILSPERYHR